jgi:hypothetical protein
VIPLRFDYADTEKASEGWGFNCGPAAICAALGLTPEEVRPALAGFAGKRYMNPSMMTASLTNLGVGWRMPFCHEERLDPPDVEFGIVCVQIGGPWCAVGVPKYVRYISTHWAVLCGDLAFDVNAMRDGGWIDASVWREQLMPWLIDAAHPRSDKSWWITHVIEIPLPETKNNPTQEKPLDP